MTPKERAAMQQALEALEKTGIEGTWLLHDEAITALREALSEQARQNIGDGVMLTAMQHPHTCCVTVDDISEDSIEQVEQAEQEPVAWVYPTEEQIMAQTGYVDMNHDDFRDFYLVVNLCKQLNSAPIRTKDLSDYEIRAMFNGYVAPEILLMFRAVIAADREKNK